MEEKVRQDAANISWSPKRASETERRLGFQPSNIFFILAFVAIWPITLRSVGLGASGCWAFLVAVAQSTTAKSMFHAFVATTTLSNRVIVPWTIPWRCNS